MKIDMTLFALLFAACILSLPLNSYATSMDDVLGRAGKEGKIVMPELGSVGCIPCEKIKPVMEQLRTSHKGKLEVFSQGR